MIILSVGNTKATFGWPLYWLGMLRSAVATIKPLESKSNLENDERPSKMAFSFEVNAISLMTIA